MTKTNFELTKEQFSDICLRGQRLDGSPLWNIEKMKRIEKILSEKSKKEKEEKNIQRAGIKNTNYKPPKYNLYCGRTLISLILPDNLNYEKKNNAHPKEPIVKIQKGIFMEGAFDKNILGSANGSLIQILNKDYGPEITSNFIDNIQFIGNAWLMVHGFSIGLGDCIINKSETDPIKDKLAECYTKAEGIKETTKNPGICEMRVTACLSEARDVGMKIAKEAMPEDNNILVTVTAGAKGDMFNVAQITGIMGQQSIEGGRITPSISHGKRTLPHYSYEIKDRDREYESRGFVKDSFIRGLDPEEFWFHQMSGRLGVISTAMKTADTGYIQRRTVKNCEDIKIYHDGTVRDANGRIIQFAYGENCLDPTKILKVDGQPLICDVARIVERLNTSFELKIPENLPNSIMPDILPVIIEEEETLEEKQQKINKSKKIIDYIKEKFPYSLVTDDWSYEQLQQRLEALREEMIIDEDEENEEQEEREDTFTDDDEDIGHEEDDDSDYEDKEDKEAKENDEDDEEKDSVLGQDEDLEDIDMDVDVEWNDDMDFE